MCWYIYKSSIGEERECLLLDEYTAATLATGESEHSEQSDISEHLVQSSSDGESSTDIDAVVKEYKDRITVSWKMWNFHYIKIFLITEN